MRARTLVTILVVSAFLFGLGTGFLISSGIINSYSSSGQGQEEAIKLMTNESIILKDIDKDLKIKLVSIEDGRCAPDVQCVRAGEITYNILVNENEESLKTKSKRSLEYEDYIIKLADESDNLEYVKFIVTKK